MDAISVEMAALTEEMDAVPAHHRHPLLLEEGGQLGVRSREEAGETGEDLLAVQEVRSPGLGRAPRGYIAGLK
jgi:hypothetical protein